MSVKLIADSGATKCEWCLIANGKKKKLLTTGISPYFLNEEQIYLLLQKQLVPKLKDAVINEVHFYGTGLSNQNNVELLKTVLKKTFKKAKISVETDLMAAARALCGREKGIACILGTGSNSCFYNGRKMIKNSPGIGYILGDEGSGAYLGKKVIQHYLYQTFDEELMTSFEKRFLTSPIEILENVYKKPLANRYLASFAIFLPENIGHYMIENIIEDGLNEFFFTHIYKYKESWTHPINFIGSIAYGFKDILQELCNGYELELGKVMKAPIKGLIVYHS